MFANAISIVDACGLTHLHVFPFSPRPGTPAARMPQLERRLVKERAARLRAKGATARASHLVAEQGALRRVLIETPGFGRTEHFTAAEIGDGHPGEVVMARIVGRTDRGLRATRVAAAL
jgi:threonylcarbamoyladenosine tRNA methylthiotransferase MtaB